MWLLLACSENNLIDQGKDPVGGTTTGVTPDILVSPAAVDFGVVAPLSSTTADLTISNQGDADLILAGIEVDSADVSWTNLSSPILAPGEAAEVVLTWMPIDTALSAVLRVDSNDPDQPSVEVPLTGSLPPGDIWVDPVLYDFGTVTVGSIATTTVTVSNLGAGPLTISSWTYIDGDGDLTVTDPGALASLPAVLDPGVSTSVTVQYAPSAAGGDEGALSLASDDPDTPSTGAQQFGNGEEDDPCEGFTQTVELMLTADDAWEGWIDGTPFTGPNASNWAAFDSFTWEMECGDHALSLYATDLYMSISGVIAVVKVEGVVRFVSGPSDWTMNNTLPTGDWTSPAYDDSSWYIPQVCADTSPWGAIPQPFYDLGASWIWWSSTCQDLGEAWLRLNFTVP